MTAITTCPVRLSYLSVFKPRAFKDGAPKYSATLMFNKSDPAQMASLKALVAEAERVKAERWPNAATGPRVPMVGHDLSPVKDCDKACNRQGVPLVEKNPEYAGHFIIRASSTAKVALVDENNQEVLDPAKIYSGCWCQVNLNPFAFFGAENQGVSFGLNGVKFSRDDERFGGGPPSVKYMFGAPLTAGADNPNNYGQSAADPFAANNEESPF